MARVKTARTTRARHKKILKRAKGYYGAKHYRFRNAVPNGITVVLNIFIIIMFCTIFNKNFENYRL